MTQSISNRLFAGVSYSWQTPLPGVAVGAYAAVSGDGNGSISLSSTYIGVQITSAPGFSANAGLSSNPSGYLTGFSSSAAGTYGGQIGPMVGTSWNEDGAVWPLC